MNFKKLFRLELPKDGANSKISTSEKVTIKKGGVIDA